MIYLLDAGVLMTANALYYPVNRIPEFWDWLLFHATEGRVKVPLEIYEEIKEGPVEEGRDLLYDWVIDDEVRPHLLMEDGEADPQIVSRVVTEGYAGDLTDSEVEQLGRDPFLISHGLKDPGGRCIVTTEVSKPGKQRQNRKVPDVCLSLGVNCIDTFELIRTLDFSTSWNRGR